MKKKICPFIHFASGHPYEQLHDKESGFALVCTWCGLLSDYQAPEEWVDKSMPPDAPNFVTRGLCASGASYPRVEVASVRETLISRGVGAPSIAYVLGGSIVNTIRTPFFIAPDATVGEEEASPS